MHRLIMFLGRLIKKPGNTREKNAKKKDNPFDIYTVEIRAAIGSTLDLMISTRRVG